MKEMGEEGVHKNLYLRMEAEREKIPNMLKEDYIPIFVARLLREKLVIEEESPLGAPTFLQQMKARKKKQKQPGGGTADQWTGDSVMEEFIDLENSYLIPEESLAFVNDVLIFAAEAIEIFSIDVRELRKCILNEIEFPSLELLWLLDKKYRLLSLSNYLMLLKHQHQTLFFTKQFLGFCFSSLHFDASVKEKCAAILEHSFHELFIAAYCNPGKKEALISLRNVVAELLHEITLKLIVKGGIMCERSQQYLVAIVKGVGVPGSVKRKHFSEQLTNLLTSPGSADEKSHSIDEVIQNQEKFADPTVRSEALVFVEFINSMIETPMTSADIVQVVTNSMSNCGRNWNRIFLLITEWIQKFEFEAISAIKDTIKRYIHEGLASQDEEKVAKGFILARHCSLVSPPKIFPRYEIWFGEMFSESYSPAKTPEVFIILTNVLKRWIPFESSSFLQTQATYWPFVPSGCREVWSEYVALAKVRVQEYNAIEDAMEFEPRPSNTVTYDVEMAIKTFDAMKKVPQSIAQMWMFKKQYYLDKFLPALLTKPKPSDPGATSSDARLRLIEALNKQGKIPKELMAYMAYKGKVDGERESYLSLL